MRYFEINEDDPYAGVRTQQPIIVYHGSPHLFTSEEDLPHGQFRLEKLGSGEGAQVYGKGLYFAENPKVAQTYKNRLTDPKGYTVPMYLDGQPVTSRNWVQIEREMWNKGDNIGGILAGILGDANRYNLRNLRQIRDHYKPDARGYNKNIPYSVPRAEWEEALRQFGKRVKMAPGRGVIYEVALHADPERDFLNWNKPVSEQPQIQPLVSEYWQPGMYINPSTWSTRYLSEPEYGGDLYQSLMEHGGHDGAAEIMLKAGLKGSKYLDKGSRTHGLGGYNYVVMNPRIIEILNKKVMR